MFCQKCGKSNDDAAKFCFGCGNELAALTNNTLLPQGELSTDADLDSDANAQYKAIIGRKNQDYYLRQFSRFDSEGKISASWHWPAFFTTFYWFLYRKMWLNALLYFVLPYIVMMIFGVIAAVAGNAAHAVTGVAYLLFFIAIFVLPALYANALYYLHCKKKILQSNTSSPDIKMQLGELSAKGGTSNVILIIVLLFLFVIVGILAAVAIPAYQDYTTRASMTEAVVAGKTATLSVASYYLEHDAIPQSLEQAGFSMPISNSVKEITMNNLDGTIIVTMANAPLKGKSFLFIPSLDANQQIAWTCKSEEIKDKYLPRECRQRKY